MGIFNDGDYVHENGTCVHIQDGKVYYAPGAKLAMRLDEIFDSTKWKEVDFKNGGTQ